MPDKTILDFTEITSTLGTDVLYTVRGTSLSRDKRITIDNLFNSIPTLTTLGQTILARDGGRLLVSGGSDDVAYSTIFGGHVKIEASDNPRLTFRDIGTFVWDIGMDNSEFTFATSLLGSPVLKLSTTGIVTSTAGFVLDNGTADSPNVTFNSLGFAVKYIDSSSGALRFVKTGTGAMGEFTDDGEFLIGTSAALAKLHVDGSFQMTGSNGNIILPSVGNEIQLTRGADNWIKATNVGGAFYFMTNGRGNVGADANLALNSDQTSTFKKAVDIEEGGLTVTGTLGDIRTNTNGIVLELNRTDVVADTLAFITHSQTGGDIGIITNNRIVQRSNSNFIFNADQSNTSVGPLYTDTIGERTVNEGVSLISDLYLRSDPTYDNSIVVNAGSNALIPEGIYMYESHLSFLIRVNTSADGTGSWRALGIDGSGAGLIVSNGLNTRVENSSGGNIALNLWKY